jgi:hypothetical protein
LRRADRRLRAGLGDTDPDRIVCRMVSQVAAPRRRPLRRRAARASRATSSTQAPPLRVLARGGREPSALPSPPTTQTVGAGGTGTRHATVPRISFRTSHDLDAVDVLTWPIAAASRSSARPPRSVGTWASAAGSSGRRATPRSRPRRRPARSRRPRAAAVD